MKLGPLEWAPLSFIHEEIKNTRLLLTVMNDLMIFAIILLIAGFIVFQVEIDQILFGSFTLVLGYLIGGGQLAKKSYFDSRSNAPVETYETAPAETERDTNAA
jgi:hypothetical protein